MGKLQDFQNSLSTLQITTSYQILGIDSLQILR